MSKKKIEHSGHYQTIVACRLSTTGEIVPPFNIIDLSHLDKDKIARLIKLNHVTWIVDSEPVKPDEE